MNAFVLYSLCQLCYIFSLEFSVRLSFCPSISLPLTLSMSSLYGGQFDLVYKKNPVIRRLYFAVTDLLNGTNLVTTMLPENLNLTATTAENLTLSTATTTGPVAQALVSTLLPEKVTSLIKPAVRRTQSIIGQIILNNPCPITNTVTWQTTTDYCMSNTSCSFICRSFLLQ